MSLLQPPRRPSSDGFVLGPHASRDPAEPFGGLDGSPDERVDLGRELDLSAERPHGSARAARGPGLFVAAIVAASLVLVGGIMMLRGDETPTTPSEPAVPMSRAAVVTAPVEPAPAEPEPAEPVPPSRVASQRVPATPTAPAITQPLAPTSAPASSGITPAAIGPTHPVRPGTAARPTTPVEPEPSTGLAPGIQLPAPVFDEPTAEPSAAPEPSPEPAPSVEPGAPAPLPGIEERPPAEPSADAPEEAAAPARIDAPPTVDPRDLFDFDAADRAPARTDDPAT